MKAFIIHDVQQNKSWIVGSNELTHFMMLNSLETEDTFHLIFEIENYGPRTIAGRFLITMQDISNIQ